VDDDLLGQTSVDYLSGAIKLEEVYPTRPSWIKWRQIHEGILEKIGHLRDYQASHLVRDFEPRLLKEIQLDEILQLIKSPTSGGASTITVGQLFTFDMGSQCSHVASAYHSEVQIARLCRTQRIPPTDNIPLQRLPHRHSRNLLEE
jgi:hypothetical protein